MTKKLLLIIFIFLGVKVFANGVPKLSHFRVENSNKNRVYFDSNVSITASNAAGFTISGKTITSVTVNAGQTTGHYFTLSSAFTFWDNNTIRYEGGSNFKDSNNNALPNFMLQHIKNNILEPTSSINRYVTINANGSGNGTSEANAWTLEQAASNASAGMTVWIKAGNYGAKNISFSNSGTVTNPIKFIGYKATTGDLDGVMYFNYSSGSSPIAGEMPLLASNGTGTALLISASNIIIENIQVSNFQKNFFIGSQQENIVINNCIGHGTPQVNYDGHNFRSANINCKRIRFINSVALNAGMSNFSIWGSYSAMINCKSYADNRQATDYYFGITGSNNILKSSLAHRVEANGHSGHGLSVKGDNQVTERNLVENCKTINIYMAIEARHDEVRNNVYRNIECKRNSAVPKKETGGIWIQNGASNNIFNSILINDLKYGVTFISTVEDKEAKFGGHENVIKNSIFSNTTISISNRRDNSGKNRVESNNKIINCTFYNNDYFFLQLSPKKGNNNKIINCNISNIKKRGLYNSNSIGWSYEHSNFYNNNNFSKPSGANNISEDPKFENARQDNFRLKSKSKLIDKGTKTNEVNFDFEGKVRTQGSSHDIGAYEYTDNSTVSINANAGSDVSICKGSSNTLTASGGDTYNWSNGATTASITVNPNETTTYTVTASKGNNSDTDDVKVTVIQAPSVNAGSDVTICNGNSVTLTATGTGEFLWSTGEATSSITVSPSETTAYTVISKNSCGSNAVDQITVNVTQIPTVNAGNDVVINEGESITLTATGSGSLKWNNGETTASIKVSPTITTTYIVTSTNGSCSSTDEVVVQVKEVPKVNAGADVSICKGDEVTLIAKGKGNFKWSTGATTASIKVQPVINTKYSVEATIGNNSVKDEVEVIIDNKKCTPTDNNLVKEMVLYPNPSNGLVNVEFNVTDSKLNISVFSISGKMVYSENIINKNSFKKQIDLSPFAKGVYIVRLSSENKNETKKVILM